jgi:hypothetical protein
MMVLYRDMTEAEKRIADEQYAEQLDNQKFLAEILMEAYDELLPAERKYIRVTGEFPRG